MKRASRTSRILATLLLAGVASSLGFGSLGTAVEKVREGIDYFSRGEFDAAGKAFTEADIAEPENFRIAFDRACALAAGGDTSKARELFQQAAMARDPELAARAHYNLGCLAAGQGRAALGDDPMAATADQRQQGLSQLLEAVGHYRDCLREDANHADARYNLELIRLFLKHIQAQWEQQDREKSRAEMDLLELLAMIDRQQVELRRTVRLLNQQSDSPQRRQTTRETAAGQAALQEEIDPLKEKIAKQFEAAAQAQAGGGAAKQEPATKRKMEEAQKLLTQLADEAGGLMADAASTLEGGKFSAAGARQRDVLDRLNQIFMAAAPFAQVLQRAIREQEQLTGMSEALTGADAGVEEPDQGDEAQPAADEKLENGASAEAIADADLPQLQWQQSRVTDWSRMLGLKAQSELPGVEAQLQAAKARPPKTGPTQPADDDDSTAPEDSATDPSAQLEGLKKSLHKGIELGPKVEEHSSAAAVRLGATDLAGALPDQQQAGKLLREIAEPLAQENQQPDNQQAGDRNDEKQDQNSQPQPQPDPRSEQQPGQSAQERAQSTLRRARQRERQHRDLQQQLQQMIGGRVRVDRDW